jgi:conjugative transfer signal peptidase TraF
MHSRTDRIADPPLFAWGEALRARRQRRRRQIRQSAALALGTLPILATIVLPPAPRLVWNASASAPLGLYLVAPGSTAKSGDTVVARVPARYRMLAATRRYLPFNVPLVKHVAAGNGDEVCALGPRIFINGVPVAERKAVDGRGRAMPWWSGCERLRADRVLLLMTANRDSFDGRYFGPSERADIVGTARLVWAR